MLKGSFCENCGNDIGYPKFNFCPLCSERVMSFRNNMKLIKGHLNREVDDYDIASQDLLRKKA